MTFHFQNRFIWGAHLRLIVGSALLNLYLLTGGARAGIPAEFNSISPETVTGRLETENGFSWNYGYDIRVSEGKVMVKVSINLVGAGGVSRSELDRVKPAWEEGIERIWSGRFALVTTGGRQYPIIIDVSFDGPRSHHDVIVRRGGRRVDALNWHLLNCPALIAHEFGHLLGVFDDYQRGALAPGSHIDATSIMTSNPSNGVTHERHYKRFLEWFAGRTGLDGVGLRQVEQ